VSDAAMLLGMLFGAGSMLGGVLLGWWLARIAQGDRDLVEAQLGQALAEEQQQEIMRLRSDASAGELGL